MKLLFNLEENPLELLSDAANYNWNVTRIINGNIVAIESDDLSDILKAKLKMIRLNVEVTDVQAAESLITTTTNSAANISIQLTSWNQSRGSFDGDVIVDGQSLTQTLIDSNLATAP